MILICGIPTEQPVALAIDAAETLGVAHLVFDQREHQRAELVLSTALGTGLSGRFVWRDQELDLATLTGVYVRLMDDRFLPDIADTSGDHPARRRSREFHDRLHAWLNVAPCRVASRPGAMLSNMSKTYQASIIRRHGFEIPETLVTTDPAAVRAFAASCAADGDGVIYKSVSGTRSIVQPLGADDLDRLDRIRWCPTQFQRQVAGIDIRVHVVGSRVFAAEIRSDATDYRYSGRQTGKDAELAPVQLPDAVAARCVRLAHALELPFSGIDLRLTPAGGYVCFEVNPSPAYSYYETWTGLPIARALVSWLGLFDGD